MSKKERDKQRKQIADQAKAIGLNDNYLFATTLHRYDRLLLHLDELEKKVDEIGVTTVKEYVRGRENVVINPAINAFNNTTSHANKTAETLWKMIKEHKGTAAAEDPLLEIMKG